MARAASDLEAAPDGSRILWTGEPSLEPPPTRGLIFEHHGADPPVEEGWLQIRRWADQDLKAQLEYEGISLWWFASHWILYGEALPSWDELYRTLRRLEAAVAREKPDRIRVLSKSHVDEVAAKAVAGRERLPVTFSRNTSWPHLKVRLAPTVLSNLRIAKLLLRGWLARRLRRTPHLQHPILVNSSSATFNPAVGVERIFQPLLARAGESHIDVSALHMDFTRRLALTELRALPANYLSWESMVTPGLVLAANGAARKLRARWQKASQGEVAGYPAEQLIPERISALGGSRLRDSILAIESARRAVERIGPRCAFLTDAYDMWGRAIVVACREKGIPTIEVQHGAIFSAHAGYLHLEGEVSPDGSMRSPYSPLPDTIAVTGAMPKEVLTEVCHYPPSSVKVTGSIMFESAKARDANREKVRDSIGARADQIVAVFFGVPVNLFPVDQLHVESFVLACKEEGIVAVLRPHPGDASNPDRYRALLRGTPATAVQNLANPWDLLDGSDIVVTHNSTTALDAMAVGRPVVHINMSPFPDMFPIVGEGRALGAKSAEELRTCLRGLKDPAARAVQADLQRPYIRRLIADIDSPSREILNLGISQPAQTRH